METTLALAPPSVPLFLRSFYRTNPVLAVLALAHVLLVPVELGLLALDTRRLDGASVWLKPLRFDVSIAIFAVSMAFVMAPLGRELSRRFANRISVMMAIETISIALQAARGVRSHFNNTSAFGAAVFTVMGIAILYNTYVVFRVLLLYLRTPDLPVGPLMRRAVVLGLTATLIGSGIGGYMSALNAHSGVHGGDLRVAHAIALHGLQLLLVAGLVLKRMKWQASTQRLLLDAAFVSHLALTTLVVFGA